MSTSLPLTSARKPVAPLVAFVILVLGALFLQNSVGSRQVLLLVVGAALGLTLYHAAFGFTSAWRVFINDRRGAGLRAQMVMLALAVLLFFPALGAGTLFGQPVVGLVAPVGVSVVFGAFIFGIGMQLGGGCASGTLFTVGGGNARMLVTLLFFICGSLIATHHVDWWFALPAFPAVSIVKSFGVVPALLASLAMFALIAVVTVRLEKRRHGQLEEGVTSEHQGLRRFLRGPWPLVWGAIGLALLNYATLALAGRPWGITSAFALWGAKVASGLGVDVASWAFWQMPGNAKALGRAGVGRHHQRHGHRHRPRCAAGRRPGRPLCPQPEDPGAFAAGRSDRWPAARLRLAPGLWLQHRRVLQWHRLGQPAWLGVAGGSVYRQRRGRAPAAVFLCRRASARSLKRLLS